MSTGEVRKVSCEDIQRVQNLIEQCLQLHMSQKEAMDTLSDHAKIEPDFTGLVWQNLEEENREFFNAYRLRLILKNQITQFNRLLERQVELMQHICPPGFASIPISDGSHIPPLHQNSACYDLEHTGPTLKAENAGHPIGLSFPDTFPNSRSSLHPCMQNAFDMSVHARRIDVSPNILLAQSSNVGMIERMNDRMFKSEAGYAGNSHYMFRNDDNVLERPAIGDASAASFSSVESNSQPMNEYAGSSSFGFLRQIPQNFSLSDLAAGFSKSFGILEGCFSSPFIATGTNSFLDPHGRVEYQGPNAPCL
ncbi:hypothetical protein U1Q18_007758 [Sarracenia purpurea var. burkii]